MLTRRRHAHGRMMARRGALRVVALLATHNEERFVGGCIEHLASQGVETYLIDNDSTDATVEIAKKMLGSGVVGIETLRRNGYFRLEPLLARKEQLAAELEADWFIHHDADEIRLSPVPGQTLTEALVMVDEAGYNAVNFQEFTFVPTREEPDHDHARFRETMRWYYPFLPSFPHRLNAWRRQRTPVDLASSGGHRISFPALSMYPESFPMKHYIVLGAEHAAEKYATRRHGPEEAQRGWGGGWRNAVAPRPDSAYLTFPSRDALRLYVSDEHLDAREPWIEHTWARCWAEAIQGRSA